MTAAQERQAAVGALFAAALQAPSPIDGDAFDRYQADVLQPLRDRLAAAAARLNAERSRA